MLPRWKALLDGPLIWNAASLYGTTVVTSGLGFVYWFVAARLASARAVGIASAMQSAAQVIAMICVLGLNTLLIAELPNNRARSRPLIMTATAAVAVTALAASLALGLGMRIASTSLRPALQGYFGLVLFVALGVVTTTLVVLDHACVGLLRGDLQFKRNTIFSATKLLILLPLTVLWDTASGQQLETAWLLGLVVSAVALSRWLWKVTRGSVAAVQWSYLRARRRLVASHYVLNLSVAAPGFVTPVLAATIVGPGANASFTAASLIAGFANTIPYQLCTVLFAIAPGDDVTLRREVTKTMAISLGVGVVAVPTLIVVARLVLGIFGPSYTAGVDSLRILALTIFPSAAIAHYVAIARIRGRMRQAALWTALGACGEIGFAAGGAVLDGITGLSYGVLAALLVEAAFFLPTVLSVRGGRGPAGTPAATTDGR